MPAAYLADPTSPIPSHCASIVATSTLRVNVIVELQVTVCVLQERPVSLQMSAPVIMMVLSTHPELFWISTAKTGEFCKHKIILTETW